MWKVKVVLFVLVVWFLWGVFQDFGVALLVGALLFIFFSRRQASERWNGEQIQLKLTHDDKVAPSCGWLPGGDWPWAETGAASLKSAPPSVQVRVGNGSPGADRRARLLDRDPRASLEAFAQANGIQFVHLGPSQDWGLVFRLQDRVGGMGRGTM